MHSLQHRRRRRRHLMVWSFQRRTVFVLDYVVSIEMMVAAALPVAIPDSALDSAIPFSDVLWLASMRSDPMVMPDECVFHLNCYRCWSMCWPSPPGSPPLPLTIGWLVTMPFVAATCIAMRSAYDSEVMHSDSTMVTAADAGDCSTSNGIWSVVSWDPLKSVGFQPLLQREPVKITIQLVIMGRWLRECLRNQLPTKLTKAWVLLMSMSGGNTVDGNEMPGNIVDIRLFGFGVCGNGKKRKRILKSRSNDNCLVAFTYRCWGSRWRWQSFQIFRWWRWIFGRWHWFHWTDVETWIEK